MTNVFFDNDWMDAAIQYEHEIRYKPIRELCNAQYVTQSRYLLQIALIKLREQYQVNKLLNEQLCQESKTE